MLTNGYVGQNKKKANSSQSTINDLLVFSLILFFCGITGFLSPIYAADTQISNEVTSSQISIDGNLGDWGNATYFEDDPDDISGTNNQIDWLRASLAHDGTHFYVAYWNRGNIHPTQTSDNSYLDWGYQTFLDTDQDSSTGYAKGTIGADYILEGNSVQRYTGTGQDWSWETLEWSPDIYYLNDVAEVRFSHALFGSPSSMNLIFAGNSETFTGGDAYDQYPDTGFFTYDFTSTPTVDVPQLTSPVPNATLTGISQDVAWADNGSGATEWWLYAGSTEGARDIEDSGSLGTATTHTVSGLPTDGRTVYVRLWYKKGSWKYVDAIYVADNSGATSTPSISSPVPNATLAGISQDVAWVDNGSGATEWWLYAGSTEGARDIEDSGSLGTAITHTVSGLPTDGRTVYVRLWYKKGSWKYVDATYVADNSGATSTPSISSPVPNATLEGISQDVAWVDNGSGATEWWLYAGSTEGARDIEDSGSLGTATTHMVSGLPTDGRSVYVRLWYKKGNWKYVDATYTSFTGGVDTTAPIITVNGGNITIVQGSVYVDAGATAIDDRDGTLEVTTSGSVDANTVGTYTIIYTAVDNSGNSTSESRIVNVTAAGIDTTPPVITIIGENPSTYIRYGSGKADFGALAIDDVDGVVSLGLITDVDYTTVGSYTLTYIAQDRAGNTSTATRSVNVVNADYSKPSITMNGLNPMRVHVGSTYLDSGALAHSGSQSSGGRVEIPVTTTGAVNTSVAGIYPITYSAQDQDGNTVTSIRSVVVQPIPPERPFKSSTIAKTGDVHVFQEFDDAYIHSGSDRSYTRNDANETVADNTTGLIWQDNIDAKSLTLAWDDASDYCSNSTQGGITNWRLPERWELLYLVDFSREGRGDRGPRIDSSFLNTFREDGYYIVGYDYWTNETDTISSTKYALYVDFRTGSIWQSRASETVLQNIRCVSGSKRLTPRFSRFQDVAIDHNNRLMWQDDAAVITNKLNWSSAIHYCENLELGGSTDWRLPNVNEAQSIIEELSSKQAYYSDLRNRHEYTDFNVKPYWWTSSTYPHDDTAFSFYAYPGSWKQYHYGKGASRYVRCVRDFSYPVVNLGGDRTVSVGEDVSFDASASSDPDGGGFTTYRWYDRFSSQVLSTEPSFTKNNFAVGRHEIVLSITDNHGLLSTNEIVLTVEAASNIPPVADAGADQSVPLGLPVNLDASNSSDSDGSITAYEWKEGSNVLSQNSTFSKNDFSLGQHVITLTVTDDQGASATDDVLITIVTNTNVPPTANAGLDKIVFEGSPVLFNASLSTDSDGTITEYEWKEGNDVLSSTASFSKSDFSVGTHIVQLTVRDNEGLTDTDDIVITVRDASVGYEMQVCPVVPVLNDEDFVDSYPDENIAWIGSNYTDVLEIEKAFNNARLIDQSVFQYLKMPSQAEWDGMSAQEQGLYLINSERQARGIKPYEGVSQNVIDVAQLYTDFIRDNNQVIGHYNDGRDPFERLNSDPVILANSDFGILPESVFATYGSSALPTASVAVLRAVYGWTYVDKFPLTGAAWGHRDQILQTELNENSGDNHKEGLIGFGVSIGDYDPYQTNLGLRGAVVTLNSFDPSSTWNNSTTQGVNIDAAQLCNNHVVVDVDDTVVSVDQLVSLEITSSDIYLTPGSSEQLQVMGTFENGSQSDITHAVSFVPDVRAIVSIDSGNVTALRRGSVYISARANGITSNSVFINIDDKTDISNLNGTFAEDYQEYIPDNATISSYDPKAFSLFTGVVKDRYGTPLSEVTLSVHNQPEYGSVKTDIDGRFVLVAEAGTRRLVYQKAGYLSIHREKNSASNGWAIVDDVVMIAVDTKQTQINLGSAEAQTHTSTVVSDQFGSRSTTLVFNGINSATIKSADGSVRSLDSFAVRATEYELPKSMPAELPVESAFTYCSELQIPGVRDDETVTFDKPVVMYVDNFLNFNVGEIVPIGYYDRNEGVWKGSDNGIVVKLLDADNDGNIDGVDYSGDDIADDINGNGSTTDETAGIENYPVGQTYWRGSFNHFTPWDFNWPYLPPTDATPPEEVKPEPSNEDKDDKECKATNSYVKPYQQSFHEDIPVTGTNLTLHYSSQRTEGYKHKISVQVSGDSVPASMTDMIVKLDIGGTLFERTFAPQANKNTEFIWDGKDPSGKRVEGVVRGRISIGYKYQAQYSSAGRITTYEELANFEQAWAQLGSNTTGITGRDDFISWNSSFIDIQNTYEAQIADGWTLSNHHESSPIGSIYKGNGDVIDGDKASLVLKTGIKTSQQTGDDGYYQKGGSEIDYAINSDGALEDKVTGLEWQYSFPRRKFREKIWASDYCDVISRDTGQAGWRLPTTKEIVYTIDKSAGNHNFPIYQFEALNYWNENTYNPDGELIPLICVKGEEINTSYIADLRRNDTDEVVVDGQNGLMWQDDISTKSDTFGWAGSIDHCENLEHAGFTNWRLPNINELTYALPNTTFVNQTEIPSGQPWTPTATFRKPYWSSTPNFNDSGQAWAMESVSFSSYRFSKSDQNYVRCVRDNIQSARSPYRFDDKRRHAKTIDLNSGITLTTYNYDDQDRLISMTDRFGDMVTLNRDINTGKVVSITSHDGYVTNLTIDENNDLTQVDYADGSNYQFIYDLKSLMTTEIKPNGHQFLHQFDANGRAIQTSDPEGGVWDFFSNKLSNGTVQYGYTSAENNTYQTLRSILESGDVSKVTTQVDGTETVDIKQGDELKNTIQSCSVSTVIDNVIDSKTKEEIPNVITITLPSGLESITEITKTYAEDGADTTKQTVTISRNGKTSSVYIDSNTGVKTITSAEGRISTLTSDPDTLLLQTTQTSGLLDTSYGYDARGRQTTVTTGDRTTTYTYNDLVSKGDVTTIIAADGKVTEFEYDLLGRVSKVIYPDGHSTQNSYDENGNLTTLVVPTPATHSFTHNSVDNVSSETTPLNEVTQYSYDRDRNLTQITLPSGNVIDNTYTDGLLTRSATPEGNIDYTYECGAKVSTVTEGSESLSYIYDGNLLTSFTYQGELDATISQSYDTDFRITTLNYAGQATTLVYDDDGLVVGINGYTISRNAQNGLPETLSDGTLEQSRNYNGYGEATSISNSVNNKSIYDYTLTYNDLGKITGKVETLDDGTVNNYVYGYDDKRQLVSVTLNGSEVESYSYDANGNRTNQSNNARGISNQSTTYNLDDQLQSNGTTTYEYDDDGYLSKKIATNGTTTYQYSSQGRLLQVNTPTDTISYQHNALGNRVAKSVNGTITEKYLWLDKTTLLATYDGSDNLIQRFEYADGNTPASYTQGGQSFYIVTDHLGTPRAITNSAGTVLKKITYDSFGNVLTDSNPDINIPFGFAGGLQDSDTGLVRFGFRDYDPDTGRWTARDPIGFAGGDSNLYGYTFNDPINFIDQDGLLPSLPQGFVDFAAGFGDVLTFGIGRVAREALGIGSVNTCSSAYSNGEIAGAIGSAATGFAGGLKSVAKASSGVNWQNFSHSLVSNSTLKKSKSQLAKWLNKPGNRLNGDHVSPGLHTRMDPKAQFGVSKAHLKANPLFGKARQTINRIPYTVGGAVYGGGSYGLNNAK